MFASVERRLRTSHGGLVEHHPKIEQFLALSNSSQTPPRAGIGICGEDLRGNDGSEKGRILKEIGRV